MHNIMFLLMFCRGPLGPTPIPNLDSADVHDYIMSTSAGTSSLDVLGDVTGSIVSRVVGSSGCGGNGSSIGGSVESVSVLGKRPVNDSNTSNSANTSDNTITSESFSVSPPVLIALYQWHNEDYHARVLSVPHTPNSKHSTEHTYNSVVKDICSHGWTLTCII